MEKKVIHKLPIHFAHVTSINHNDTLFSEIVQGENLPLRYRPSEESHFQRSLGSPNTFPGKMNSLNALTFYAVKTLLYHNPFRTISRS
jgi:hypothetical protein